MRRPTLAATTLTLLLLPWVSGPRRARADEAPAAEKPAAEKPAVEKPPAEKPTEPKEAVKAPETPPEPTLVTAEKGPFTVVLELSGVFEAPDATEVVYDPETWNGELETVEAVPGGRVEKDQVLVRFKTEAIDEAIEGAAKELEIVKKKLEAQQEDVRRAEEGQRIALARAKVERDRAVEALEWFRAVEREMRVRQSELGIQGGRDNLSDQEEELAQLRKMYKADDVVEETEDIVMKRTVRALERTKANFDMQLVRQRRFLETGLPSDLDDLEANAQRESFELDKALALAPLQLEQGRLELEKGALGLTRLAANLGKLVRDREALVVRAPRAGIAIPGACVRGKWAGIEETGKALRKGGKLRAGQPLFTIVEPGAVTVRTTVGEAELLQVAEGQAVEVAPTVDPKKPLPARVARVARASGDGQYVVGIELGTPDERLMPGFTCKAKVTVARREEAVTVPAGSVAVDGERKLVHVFEDGKAAPREVEEGATSGGRTEIRKGLAAGERVLKTPPK